MICHLSQELNANVLDLLNASRDRFKKFKECCSTKDRFYSILTNCAISDKNYKHVPNISKAFKIDTKNDYHDLYLKVHVLL